MPESVNLPSPDVLRRLLSDLFLGKGVTVKRGAPMPYPPTGAFVLVRYKSAGAQEMVVCICDLAFASAAGAALSLIPPAVVKECVRAGKLSETLAENVHEIFNVCSGLFNKPDHPRLALDAVLLPPVAHSSLPAAKPTLRSDFEIAIDGYGSGKLCAFPLKPSHPPA